MYAIVKTGGKQYRVEKGQKLLIERVREDEGATVTLEPVLFRSDDVVFGEDLAKVKVEAKVVEHLRGPKIRVFKFKPKRGYKRTQGHRQDLTRIEVTDIKMLSRKPAEKKTAEPKAAAAGEPAADAQAAEAAPKKATRASAAKKTTGAAAEKKPGGSVEEKKAGSTAAKKPASTRAKKPADKDEEA
jgi:large subunit ribosomal protein L21